MNRICRCGGLALWRPAAIVSIANEDAVSTEDAVFCSECKFTISPASLADDEDKAAFNELLVLGSRAGKKTEFRWAWLPAGVAFCQPEV